MVFRRGIWGLLFVLLFSTCATPTTPTQPHQFHTSVGNAYTWLPEDFPLTIILDPKLLERRKLAVKMAARLWNENIGIKIFVLGNTAPESNPSNVLVFRTIMLREDELGYSSTGKKLLGWAILHHDSVSGRMYSADVALDTSLTTFWEELAVVLHEFGHVLTLSHDRFEPDSLMFPYPSINSELTDYDIWLVRQQVGLTGSE